MYFRFLVRNYFASFLLIILVFNILLGIIEWKLRGLNHNVLLEMRSVGSYYCAKTIGSYYKGFLILIKEKCWSLVMRSNQDDVVSL